MVISVDILNCTVRKDSRADILYYNTFKQLGILEDELKEYHELLVSFSRERVETHGCIDLYTSFGPEHEGKSIKVTYLVVHANTSYNILLDRPSLNKLKAIVPTPHLAMKFSSEKGRIMIVHSDQKIAREYLDMLGINPEFPCHHLSVYKGKTNSTEKKKIGGELAQAVQEETTKLLQAGFIREVKYSTWFTNVVMVKKANEKWRMCTDFTDLNKACPKDVYPLPNIDNLVDGARP
ncbi:uncharacterized protein LOC113870423 [Abrus precatorius]|uniref:Uncharacterized protein LOC113870423 n=1 Tax=Abrus precatorius TaxID=3816 RepID=A0A8B8M2Q6_ABRPR|nr:uncharacterized protein LOC113870423 [Abrus precatorius]